MILRRIWGLLLLGVLSGCSPGGPGSCKVDVVANLPLLPGRHLPTVEASLNARKVALFIDTGAATSIVTPSAAREFELPADAGNNRMMLTGIGGSVFVPVVTLRRLGLGNGTARNIDLPVAGELGPPVMGLPVIGLFGADFLANYDVDIDLPGHHFAIYTLEGCGSALQPVGSPYFEVPFRLEGTNIMVDLKLNDKPITAVLDSGASHTLLSHADARRAGVTAGTMARDSAAHAIGVDLNPLKTHIHRFGSLEIGAERMNNFPFVVGDTSDSLLGDDFLYFNRVWISYPLRKLFIQPSMQNPLVHMVP